MSFPSGPAELDAAWLEDVLRRDGRLPDARVHGVSVSVIGAQFGLEGTSARLSITGDGIPATLVAKWGAAGGAREARFYRELASRLPLAVPRFFASAVDEASDRALLLMEDVSPATQGDVLAGVVRSEMDAATDALAALHASFWNRPDDPSIAWLPLWAPDVELRVRQTREVLPRFLDAWGERLTQRERRVAEDSPARLPAAYARLHAAPTTLIHGDFHLDNVLFRPDGMPVVLDWPRVARGPAVVDFSGLLVRRMLPSDRRALRQHLTLRYARALSQRGVRDYDAERVVTDTSAGIDLLFAGTIRWAARTDDPRLANERVRALVENGVRTTAAAVVEQTS